MKIDGIHASSEDGISYVHHILCEKCQNSIEVPIKKSEKDSAVGGIFRIVVVHQCVEEQLAFMLYFDENFALRQKVSCPVTVADLHQIDLLEKTQYSDTKQYNAYNYLYKKLGDQLAKVIYGAIIGQQIVFVGEKLEVEPTCLAISAFTTHRITYVDCWELKKSNASIIGTSPANIDLYKNALIVNLPKNHVINGIDNKHCLTILENLSKVNSKEEFFENIDEQLKSIIGYCNEFAMVESFDEIEDYLTALALEDFEQDLLNIVLAISSQMNHKISSFYRNFIDITDETTEKLLQPMTAWIYRKTTKETKEIVINPKKLPIYTRDNFHIEELKSIVTQKFEDEVIIEYITPLSYVITFFDNLDFYSFKYARTASEDMLFNNTLLMLDENLDFFSDEKVLQELDDLFLKNKFEEITSKKNTQEKSPYTKMKEILNENLSYSVLQRHYISSIVCSDKLKKFSEKVTELITEEYRNIDPKIFHYNNLFVIKETITDIECELCQAAEKMNVSFNINFLVSKNLPSNLVDIVLELYIEPSEYKLGYEFTLSFLQIYQKFNNIIRKAQEACQD